MKREIRWTVFAFVLALLLATAHDRAQSQAPTTTSAAPPFQIRQTAYIKSSNPHANDNFGDGGNLPGHSGNSIAISDDGNYLAVGAHQESSAAKGVNGNQADTSAPEAGSAYVFY